LAVALAKRYCRDDTFAMEWTEYLHSEVERIRAYVNSNDYPKAGPAVEAMNGIVDTFIVRGEILRRACLICGRWGTLQANQAVVVAIQSLSFGSQSWSGYVSNESLREFASSICFYWNLAGLLYRSDWSAIRALETAEQSYMRSKVEAIMVAPFGAYASVDWKFITGFERRDTPISDFLAAKFITESRDIALGVNQADDLFDRTELAIAFGFAHTRGKNSPTTWMPGGRFMWRNGGQKIEDELNKIEGLPDSDPFFKAGMLGGTKEAALITIQKIRGMNRRIL
jgi:hypothetical protein